MRSLILFLIGDILGAVLFHVYYLRLDATRRCHWDHPIDAAARRQCEDDYTGQSARGYASHARHDLDGLINRILK